MHLLMRTIGGISKVEILIIVSQASHEGIFKSVLQDLFSIRCDFN